MSSEFLSILQTAKFDKQIEKMAKKYKNKKIVIYGAGQFFQCIKNNYDLSSLNIIAVSDKKFMKRRELTYDENIGFNTISPESIVDLEPDIVLIAVVEGYFIEQYIYEILFKECKKKFKYKMFVNLTLKQKMQRVWETF